jgi:phage tail sheath protein FI
MMAGGAGRGRKEERMTYLSPGVYVEEVPASSRPIEGVGTAIAAFVGFAAEGPLSTPERRAAALLVAGAAFAVTVWAVRRQQG